MPSDRNETLFLSCSIYFHGRITYIVIIAEPHMKPVSECTETVQPSYPGTIGKPQTVPIMTRTLIFRRLLLQLPRSIPLEMIWTASPSFSTWMCTPSTRHFGGVMPGADTAKLVENYVESRRPTPNWPGPRAPLTTHGAKEGSSRNLRYICEADQSQHTRREKTCLVWPNNSRNWVGSSDGS